MNYFVFHSIMRNVNMATGCLWLRMFCAMLLWMMMLTSLCAQVVKDSVWNKDIRTVLLTCNDTKKSLPVLRLGSHDKLLLRFDELGNEPQNYQYRISHCDAQWRPDHLDPIDFISGFEEGSIENYGYAFTTLQMYVHYSQIIPSAHSTFVASGNYELRVVPYDDPDSCVLTCRFMVYEDLVSVESRTGKPTTVYGDFRRDQEVNLSVSLRDGVNMSLQPQYLQVFLQQNGRIDLRRSIPFHGYNGNALLYALDRNNVFPGGNCFRFFDISDAWAQLYNVQRVESYGGETFVFLRPDQDRSRKNFSYTQSLNGGMRVNVVDRDNPDLEADYVWVNFSLPMSQPFLDGSLYLVGDLTQWRFDDGSRMEYNMQYRAYTKRLHLKQGYYSYQYVFVPSGTDEGLTSRIEGDHYEMPNEYLAMVYVHRPVDRYDRLVGCFPFVFGDR